MRTISPQTNSQLISDDVLLPFTGGFQHTQSKTIIDENALAQRASQN